MVGYSYRLEMPGGWRGTDTFHADRLRRYDNNPLPGQEVPQLAADEIDGYREWEVEEILSSRLYYKRLQYQVRWKGWEPDATWYPASDFRNAATKLISYHADNPERPGPPLRLLEWKRMMDQEEELVDHPDDEKAVPESSKNRMRRSAMLTHK